MPSKLPDLGPLWLRVSRIARIPGARNVGGPKIGGSRNRVWSPPRPHPVRAGKLVLLWAGPDRLLRSSGGQEQRYWSALGDFSWLVEVAQRAVGAAPGSEQKSPALYPDVWTIQGWHPTPRCDQRHPSYIGKRATRA